MIHNTLSIFEWELRPEIVSLAQLEGPYSRAGAAGAYMYCIPFSLRVCMTAWGAGHRRQPQSFSFRVSEANNLMAWKPGSGVSVGIRLG